jgi:sortase A
MSPPDKERASVNRGWTVVSLMVLFVMLGPCTRPDRSADLVAGGRTSWWGAITGLADSEPSPPPEARVMRRLREIREEQREGTVPRRADDPNVGVPPAIVAAALDQPRSKQGTIGRLAIPAIGLDVAYRSGVHEAVVNRGPGHWPGTPLPGNAGNSVLSGHRTTFTHPFGDLDLLERGDRIRTSVGSSGVVVYRVAKTTIVAESQYVKFILRKPVADRARRLTLFACHPKGSRRERIVVTAVADSVRPDRRPGPDHLKGGVQPSSHVADSGDIRNR